MIGLKLVRVSKRVADRVHNSWVVLYVVGYIYYYGERQ